MANEQNHKGWPVLVGGGLVNVALGTYYAWSTFVPALEKEFHWTRTQTSIVPTIDMITLASSFLLAGFLQNRFGPRTVGVIGGLLFSAGLYLASFTNSLSTLYLTWGLMVGIGLGFGYAIPIAVGSKWFPHQRGLVNGLAIGIFAAGSGIFGPIGGTMIEHIGWRSTFQVLAGLFFLFTVGGALMMKDPPPGFKAGGAPKPKTRTTSVEVTTSGVLKQPTFYALWIAYALGTTAGTMVISQLVPFALGSGYDPAAAKFALTVGAAGSALGRFFSGWMSDHLGRLPTLRVIILISMIATPTLYMFRSEIGIFYVLLFFVYYCYGTQLSVYTALAGDFWGAKYLATNYGLLLMAWGTAGLMGPQLGARIFDTFKNYEYAFFGASGLALAALVILLAVRTPSFEHESAPAPVLAGR